MALVLSCLALSTHADNDTDSAEEGLWERNVQLMFHRDQPRNFARTFEDFDDYLVSNDGFFYPTRQHAVLPARQRNADRPQ